MDAETSQRGEEQYTIWRIARQDKWKRILGATGRASSRGKYTGEYEEENEDDLAFSDLIPNIQSKTKSKAKAKHQPKTKLAQPKQATVEVEGKQTGPAAVAASPRAVASPARVGNTQDQSGKGRGGKGGIIPQYVEGKLKFDGFDGMDDCAHKLVEKLSLKPPISMLETPI